MDIVSRLKKYMSSLTITSTQFADACNIPRPSLSQLLNGRNKKVSDEILTKIHDSFPDLSIPWLLFGEGPMVINENRQISEPQNDLFQAKKDSNTINNQRLDASLSSTENFTIISSNNLTDTSGKTSPEILSNTATKLTDSASTSSAAIKLNTSPNKRITNIVVFYDDNSFESFIPA